MKRFEWMACVFVGIPCVVVLLAVVLSILPNTNIVWGIFVLSCIVMSVVVATARLVKGIHETFFKKDKDV